eukprot:3795324-Amphidinium_carterae.3
MASDLLCLALIALGMSSLKSVCGSWWKVALDVFGLCCNAEFSQLLRSLTTLVCSLWSSRTS